MTQVFYGGSPAGGGAGGAGGGKTGGFQAAQINNAFIDGIELKVIRTVACTRRPVMHGPTRVCDEFTYDCYAIWNPSATSYRAALGELTPLEILGEKPTNTDDAIRHFLLNPNRRFILMVGNDLLLESPPPGRRCDAQNGPIPTHCDIVDVWGNITFLIRWGCKTWINPCERVAENNETAILSHRWSQERSVDADGMSSLLTRGRAIFDTGKLLALNKIPDDYWAELYRPLERGFRRDSVQVVAAEDGTELEYALVDRETPVSLLKDNVISRVEATYTGSISRGDVVETLKDVVRSFLEKDKKTKKRKPGGLGRALTAASGLIPECTHSITVRAWGYRYIGKREITRFCQEMIAKIIVSLPTPQILQNLGNFTNDITWDMMGRFVECNASWTMPPFWAGISTAEAGLGITDSLWPELPAGNTSPNTGDEAPENIDDILDEEARRGPGLPFPARNAKQNGGALGTWLGRIAAQELTRACQRQPTQKANITAAPETTLNDGGV